jgi:hypothetical protein
MRWLLVLALCSLACAVDDKFLEGLPPRPKRGKTPEIPDHKRDSGLGPIWLDRKVRVTKDHMYLRPLFGKIGQVTGFEEKTGRYLVDFDEDVNSAMSSTTTRQFALHPVNLEPFDGDGAEAEAAKAAKPEAKKAEAKEEL